MSIVYTTPEFRSLSLTELRLLEWLLAHGTVEAANYAAQISRASVVSRCTCGCPTLDLALDGKGSPTAGCSMIPAEAGGRSPEGVPVNVVLHACEGGLSELEVIALDGTKGFGMPAPDMLVAV